MQDDKVTFAQAAKVLNLHPNTLKNWQKSGKLDTAEKRKVNGVITWLVDFDEVTAINEQNFNILDSANNYQPAQPHQEGLEQAKQGQPDPPKQATQTTQIQPNIEANLVFFRETVVAPLTALIKEQGNQIAELSVNNGRLEERVKNLEAQLQAAQALPQPSPTQEQVQPVTIEQPAQIAVEPVKKGFWARLLGG